MAETTNAPKRKRRGHIRPEQVEQRLMEIAERCMEETPRMVYNKSLKQWEEDGSYTFAAGINSGRTAAMSAGGAWMICPMSMRRSHPTAHSFPTRRRV